MVASAKSLLAVLLAVAAFTQDVQAGHGMSRRRYVPGRAGLHTVQRPRKPLSLPVVRSVESDQSSLELNPNQIGPNLAKDGQDPPVEGQEPSITTTNNWINFCETEPVPLTNGTQIKGGSCNQTPMGRLIAADKMPSCKFEFPFNGVALKTNTSFTIKLNLRNLNAGHFTNPTVTYYANPQTVDDNGIVIGHTHVTIEKIASYTTTDLPVPTNFAFFKGVDGGANAQGQVTVDVTGGLPDGFYKLSSINTAATHQPVLVVVAQHGGTDDSIFFEVNSKGVATVDIENGAASIGGGKNNSADSTSSASDVATGTASVAATETASVASDSVTASDSASTSDSASATATSSASATGNNGNGKGKGKNGGKKNGGAAAATSASTESSSASSSAAAETSAAASSSESSVAASETAASDSISATESASVTETTSSTAAEATGNSNSNGKSDDNKKGGGRGGRGRRSSRFW